MVRIFSIIVATLLAVYLILAAIFFEQDRHQSVCREVQVVVADSLEKHFVSEGDLAVWLKRAGLNPVGKPLREINTERIEQIYVHPDKEVELIPRVGNHRILLGTFDHFEEKLANLRLFYEQAIPKMGWEKYSIINLKYRNQIVCTKR